MFLVFSCGLYFVFVDCCVFAFLFFVFDVLLCHSVKNSQRSVHMHAVSVLVERVYMSK